MAVEGGIRFGICSGQNLPFPALLERWRRFEELGFDSAWVFDHFNRPSAPTGPYFEGWTALAALAAGTERIRVGVLVSCNTFRHPALLAHQALTVDHVSNGRLELGLGAGWWEPEHERFGLAFPPPGERVGRFEEAVQVVDSLLRREETTFAGRYYRLSGAYLRPGPVQRPRPPLTLAGHGPRMLRICARHADRWNSHGTVEEMRERNRILDEHCAAIGRDPRALRRSLYAWTNTDESRGVPDPWESVAAFEEVVGLYAAAGIEELLFDPPRPHQLDVLEQVAAEAMPRLRASPPGA